MKASGDCPKELSNSVIFVTELQRREPWENIPLEFR